MTLLRHGLDSVDLQGISDLLGMVFHHRQIVPRARLAPFLCRKVVDQLHGRANRYETKDQDDNGPTVGFTTDSRGL